MGEFEPLSAKPTMAELARAINATHACLDDHRADSRRNFNSINAQVGLILLALGIDPDKPPATRPRQTLATMKPWQLIVAFMVGIGPVMTAWSWALRFGPTAWQFFLQLNHIVASH